MLQEETFASTTVFPLRSIVKPLMNTHSANVCLVSLLLDLRKPRLDRFNQDCEPSRHGFELASCLPPASVVESCILSSFSASLTQIGVWMFFHLPKQGASQRVVGQTHVPPRLMSNNLPATCTSSCLAESSCGVPIGSLLRLVSLALLDTQFTNPRPIIGVQ